MKQWIILIVLMAAALAAAVAGALRLAGPGETAAPVVAPEDAEPQLPDPWMDQIHITDFELEDQDGRPLTPAIFDGRITILALFFTHCPTICPGMSFVMGELQRDLADTSVRMLSISVDPEHDTPERLREYAEQVGADPGRWVFARGPYEQVHQLSREGLLFELSADEDFILTLKDGSTMANIVHPSKLILVGPDRKVLAYYTYSNDDDVSKLKRRVRMLDRYIRTH